MTKEGLQGVRASGSQGDYGEQRRLPGSQGDYRESGRVLSMGSKGDYRESGRLQRVRANMGSQKNFILNC